MVVLRDEKVKLTCRTNYDGVYFFYWSFSNDVIALASIKFWAIRSFSIARRLADYRTSRQLKRFVWTEALERSHDK